MDDAASSWREVLRRTVGERFGHDVSATAFDRIEDEVARIATERGEAWADAYVGDIARSPIDAPVVQALVALATNKESYFFRDEPAMTSLREDILPRAIDSARAERCLRVWSAGCSTGEEIYTASILLHELLGAEIDNWRLTLVGTDLDARALRAASSAEYGPWSFRATPPELLDRYFEPVAGTKRRRVRARYRAGVTFSLQNLAEPTVLVPRPFEFDLVLCRNVTIYFTRAARENLTRTLLTALSRNGCWIGGPSDPVPETVAARVMPGLLELRRSPQEPPQPEPQVSPAPSASRPVNLAPTKLALSPTPAIAKRSVERSRQGASDPDELQVAAARICADRGDVAKASALLSAVIERGTVAHHAYLLRAILHEASGENELAIDHYKRALYLEPRVLETHARLGLLQCRMGETGEAIRSLRNAIALGARRERDEVTDRLTVAAANQLARLLTERRDAPR